MSGSLHKFTGTLTTDTGNGPVQAQVAASLHIDSRLISGSVFGIAPENPFPTMEFKASIGRDGALLILTESLAVSAASIWVRSATDLVSNAGMSIVNGEILINISGAVAVDWEDADNSIVWGLTLTETLQAETLDSGATDRVEMIKKSKSLGGLTAERINEAGSAFDHYGYASGVDRLSEESNSSLRKRVLDAIANRGSSTVQGLSNAIGRDLGLGVNEKLLISVKKGVLRSVYETFRVVIKGGKIKIYSMWIDNKTLVDGTPNWRLAVTNEGLNFDFKLEDFSVGEIADQVGRIKLSIDGKDVFPFTAVVKGDTDYPATGLQDFDSRLLVTEELLSQHKMRLSRGNIFRGSVVFENDSGLLREVSSESELVLQGDYTVNYDTGRITFFRPPEAGTRVAYMCYLTEFSILGGLIGLIDMQSEFAQEVFFEQVPQRLYRSEEEKYLNGIPTKKMFGIIRKILTSGKRLHYWGE